MEDSEPTTDEFGVQWIEDSNGVWWYRYNSEEEWIVFKESDENGSAEDDYGNGIEDLLNDSTDNSNDTGIFETIKTATKETSASALSSVKSMFTKTEKEEVFVPITNAASFSNANEFRVERDMQAKAFDADYSDWKNNLTTKLRLQYEDEAQVIKKNKRIWGTVIGVLCVVVPILLFVIAYSESPLEYFEDTDTSTSSDTDEFTKEDYATMSICSAMCLPFLLVPAIIDRFGKDKFHLKEEDLLEIYPFAKHTDEQIDEEMKNQLAKSLGVEPSRIDGTRCPRCESYMERLGTGGRALKAAGRGFAKYARWEQRAMGTSHSVVGRQGGIFDSMTSDASYKCPKCGHKM